MNWLGRSPSTFWKVGKFWTSRNSTYHSFEIHSWAGRFPLTFWRTYITSKLNNIRVHFTSSWVNYFPRQVSATDFRTVAGCWRPGYPPKIDLTFFRERLQCDQTRPHARETTLVGWRSGNFIMRYNFGVWWGKLLVQWPNADPETNQNTSMCINETWFDGLIDQITDEYIK